MARFLTGVTVVLFLVMTFFTYGCSNVGNLVQHRALEAACVYQEARAIEAGGRMSPGEMTLCEMMLAPPTVQTEEEEPDEEEIH